MVSWESPSCEGLYASRKLPISSRQHKIHKKSRRGSPRDDNNFERISLILLGKHHKIHSSHTDSSFHICSLDRMDKFDLVS